MTDMTSMQADYAWFGIEREIGDNEFMSSEDKAELLRMVGVYGAATRADGWAAGWAAALARIQVYETTPPPIPLLTRLAGRHRIEDEGAPERRE